MGIPSQVAVLVTLALMEPLWHQPRVPTTVAVASKILAAALMGVRQRVLHAQAMAEPFVPAAILVISFLAQVVQLSPAQPTLLEAMFLADAHAELAFMAPSQLPPVAPTSAAAAPKILAAAAMGKQQREPPALATVDPYAQAVPQVISSLAAAVLPWPARPTRQEATFLVDAHATLVSMDLWQLLPRAPTTPGAVPRTRAAAAMDKQRQEPPAPAMVEPFVLAAALGMSSLQVLPPAATPSKRSDR
jgi:hypothetical protein